MDRKDYLKSRISEALKGPIEESYKKKYETAPEGVKAVADHMAMLKKQPTDTLKRMANQHYKVHSAKSKNEFIGMLMRAKFGKKKLEAHDSHFQTEQKQGVAEGSSGVSVRHWANKVRKDHGSDVKFRNRQEGGGAVDSVIAKNSQGETVGVYNRKTRFPTVYAPKQGVAEEVKQVNEVKVGDKVHVGMNQKGGSGFKGTVHKIDGENVHVKVDTTKYGDRIVKGQMKNVTKEEVKSVSELSTELLGRYKKAAVDSYREADKRGDVAKTNKRFKGTITATNKQFANDLKKRASKQNEEVEPVNEASQKLMNYLRDKHGAALQKMSSPELQKAKKAAAAEMKAKTAEKKAAAAEAPKEKVKDTGEHIVVQMRKIADYKPGKYPVRVSPKRSVNVHSDAARKVVASHDQLKKPVDKRKFRISLTQRLRKLKEQLENGRR